MAPGLEVSAEMSAAVDHAGVPAEEASLPTSLSSMRGYTSPVPRQSSQVIVDNGS